MLPTSWQATNRKNGEGVLLRVQEHTRDNHADYFNDVIILTTQNNSFGPTEISHLEKGMVYTTSKGRGALHCRKWE